MGRTKDRIEQIRWLPCLNVYGAEIPAFAAVRVTAATAGGVLSVSRPNADHQYVYLTGPTPIPTASYGICTRDTPIFAYYDTANTPAEGEAWGAKSGTFKLTKNYSGFYIHGGHGNERVYVRRVDGGTLAPQSGAGVPSHVAAIGTQYYNTSNLQWYTNYNGSTGWTVGGHAYDMLGARVYTEQAKTTTFSVVSTDYLGWIAADSTGPYTGTYDHSIATAFYNGQCWGFRCKPAFTGILTLDLDGTEEIQGPRGNGGAVNRTRKYVHDENVVLMGDGANARVVFETMLEVGFSAENSGTQSSIATATATKLTFDTEVWDINANFASSTHTPLAPGIYHYGGTVGLAGLGDGKYCKLMLYKNGSLYKTLAQVNNGAAADVVVSGSAEVSMNGSTDTVELYVEHNHGSDRDTIGTAATSHFYGSRIRRDES